MASSRVETRSISGTKFSDVDRSDDPQARVQYLDLVTNTTDYKRESIALLGLQPGDSVLDVGCGAGDDVRLAAELVGPSGRAVGIDPSATMIGEAKRRGQPEPVEFQQGDVYHLTFPDDSFDAVRADRVFQHLLDPLLALAEMMRVTRPGGVVYVADPDWETLVVDVPNRALFRKIRSHFLDTHTGRYSGSQLYGQFHSVGLRDVRVSQPVFVTFTDFTVGNQLCNLTSLGEDAFEAGAITADEYAEWQETLSAFEQTGPFFMGIGGTGVSGVNP